MKSIMINKYVKRPVIIEAIEFDGSEESKTKIIEWTEGAATTSLFIDDLFIRTLEGLMTAQKGDFIIKGVKGEFYPCKPDIFHVTYDKVEK